MGTQREGSQLPLDYEITSTFPELNNIQDIPDKLTSSFQKQLEVFPQEKIYVHTDKPYYISGEKIWFRAYVADAKSHEPVYVSRYVYVELINPFNAVVARVKIRQEEGAYHGYLSIPGNAPGGDYTMRAYTAFMQNLDENYLFTKTVYIGDPQDKATHPSTNFDDDFDVSFYPEGGSLMQGTFCKVAFKAMKSDGQSTNISGTVYDNTGKEIKEFKSEHLGMGSFLLLAEKGKNYYAVCRNEKEQSKRFDLPVAVNSGYALSITGVKDKMYVSVRKPAGVAQNDELYLLAHTRGTVHFVKSWDTEKNYLIQPEQFPSGVLHLILFDAGLNPVSERLVFINNNDQAQVNYQPDKENYAVRSLVKNRVTLTNSEGQPLEGSFSVAVTSDKEVMSDSTSNILTQLLLTSDLRGNIENPAYYFQNTTASALALDLLMCTQGWRRYNIAEFVHGNFAKPVIPILTTSKISGIVKNDLLGTPAKNIEVIIYSLKHDYFDKAQTDKDGRFSFHDIEWSDADSALFSVSVKMKKTTTAKNLIIDKENFPKRTLFAPPRIKIDKELFAQYADKADRQYVLENGARVIQLPEVSITTQQKLLKKSLYYDLPNYTITGDYISKFPASNILWYLITLPSLFVDINTSLIMFRGSIYPPCLIVDGMIWGRGAELKEQIDAINPSSIAQIDILNPSKAAAYGTVAFGGAIIVYTKGLEDYKYDENNKSYIKNISPLGYQQPVAFYAPKYNTSEKRNVQTLDLRTTIHWQPVVKTDEQGVASFEFYTADKSTSYTVIIEGLAEDGSIIRQEGKLWIKDK
jgi:5-hydroxyisourate hydrolase-like protein (transthyretin family)